jgi:hypothetical protein
MTLLKNGSAEPIYHRIYNSLIEKRKGNAPEGYSERHHIVPRSLGGSDSEENLVRLTAREHFVAHCLLARMQKRNTPAWFKMHRAVTMMKCHHTDNRYFNSRLYDISRNQVSIIMSMAQNGSKNSNYGNRWICNVELRVNAVLRSDSTLPENWIFGRSKWKIKPKKTPEQLKIGYETGAKKQIENNQIRREAFRPFYDEWKLSGEKVFAWFFKNEDRLTVGKSTFGTYVAYFESLGCKGRL